MRTLSSLLFLAIAVAAFVTALEADLHGSCGDCCDEGPCGECALCWCSYSVPQAEPIGQELKVGHEATLISFVDLHASLSSLTSTGIDRPPRS